MTRVGLRKTIVRGTVINNMLYSLKILRSDWSKTILSQQHFISNLSFKSQQQTPDDTFFAQLRFLGHRDSKACYVLIFFHVE